MTFDACQSLRLSAGRPAVAARRGVGVATIIMITTPSSEAGRTRAS